MANGVAEEQPGYFDFDLGGPSPEESAYFATDRLAQAATRRTWTPSSLRVATTVTADALSLSFAAIVALDVASRLRTVPVFSRVLGYFPVHPRGGLLSITATVITCLLVFYAVGMYKRPGRKIGWSTLSDSVKGLTALTSVCWLLFVGALFVFEDDGPAGLIIAFWLVAAALVPLTRSVCRMLLWSHGAFAERTLIIGAGTVGNTLAAKIKKHPELRIRLVGFLDDGEPLTDGGDPALPVIGRLTDLPAVISRDRVTRVIIAFSRGRHQQFLDVARTCADANVRINIVPRLFEVISSRAGVDDIEGIPLLDIANVELSRVNMFFKRVFDLVVGGLMLVFVLPVVAVLAVVIKLDSPGPVFYRQERMGRGGRVFRVFKLRSMTVDAEKLRHSLDHVNEFSGPMFKMKQDPRVTRVGRWLRRWSLDELPQLFNVVIGDMSLVGPRPLWVEEAKQCRGWTQKRLDITPGITGLWQVLGRNDIPFNEMVKLDYMYVTGWSLSWDVRLLVETIPTVIRKRGAY